MTDAEALDLIFAPGFSTAERITNISGRGVGMDVVRTCVDRVGGTVEVRTVPGGGTTFRVRIPLTLAIVPALLVESAGDRFAIPQVDLVELVRLEGDEVRTGIELFHGAPVHRLRGRLLPLVDLRLALAQPAVDREVGAVSIVVLRADDRRFGLVVDRICDTAEIVVKPLARPLAGLDAYAGATITGDGTVALILDVLGLARRAGIAQATGERRTDASPVLPPPAAHEADPLLLFGTPDDGRMAMPLRLVDRLEELDRDAVEHAGDRAVVRFRGEILPLVEIADVLPERRAIPRTADGAEVSARAHVIVHDAGDRRVGLVVSRILDVVEDPGDLQPASRDGALGTVVVQDRVTEVVDLPAILAAAGLAPATVGAGER